MTAGERFTAAQARRIALAAQGFGTPRPATPAGRRQILSMIERLGVIQLDSVNVVSRTHYLPLFSRLGDYPRSILEDLAWGRKPALFEYWAHEAALMPLSDHPLLRWRMEDARKGVGVWRFVARVLAEQHDLIEAARERIAAHGPMTASQLEVGEKGEGGWWGWSESKRVVECLFWIGEVTARTRRNTFERVYDLTERVIPRAIFRTPAPPRDEAQRALIMIAARAMGVATERDLRDYFRMGVAETRARVAELVDAGDLIRAEVKGWDQPAYLHPNARRPRRVTADALLSPFDNLIWFRERTERLFGVRVRLEIYTPAHKRTHGYYVLPFLQDEAITARVDLKADRKASVLIVQAAHAEAAVTPQTAPRLAAELRLMARWLGLADVRVEPKGDLAEMLAQALENPPPQGEVARREAGETEGEV